MPALMRIRQAIREQRYRISAHANEEMSEDNLLAGDVETVILTGQVRRKYTHDPRGTRHEIVGETVDGRQAYVICRFLASGVLQIITAYVPEVL